MGKISIEKMYCLSVMGQTFSHDPVQSRLKFL